MATTWMNDDGLLIKYGPDSSESTHRAGEYLTYNGKGEQVIEVTIDLTELTQTETILNDAVKVPTNAHITSVEVLTVVAALTGTAIDVGLVKDDRSTEGDYNGFLAAFPTSQMNAIGETSRFFETHTEPASLTGTGALIGQEITYTGGSYISASMTDATSFTAGTVKVRIAYVPKGIDNP